MVELMRVKILDYLEETARFHRFKQSLKPTILAGRFMACKSNVDPTLPGYGIVNGTQDFEAMQGALDEISPHLINLLVFKSDCTPAKDYELIFEGNHRNHNILPIVVFKHEDGVIDYFGVREPYATFLYNKAVSTQQ